MSKLRVALVSPYPPSMGTLNEYAFHLVEKLKNKSEVDELVILTDQLPEGQEYDSIQGNVNVRIEEVWSFNSLWNFSKISKALKRIEPDVVFYNIQFLSFGDKKIPATLGLLSPLLSRMSGYKSVVLLHNIIETVDYDSAGITKNPILKSIYNFTGTLLTRLILSANLVTVTIAKYVNILEAKYKVKNVALVPHGSFEIPPLPTFDLPPGPKKVMTFGKFGTYKKVEPLIEAVELVRQRTSEEIEIVIAGTDNPNKKGYLQKVSEIYSHVPGITYTGYVQEEDVPRIFRECAVTVFPYTSTTGSSGVLHQAGSYGKAAILPHIGDLKELTDEEGYAGAFFEPEDVEGLADAIQKVLQDEEYRKELGIKNYAAAASLPIDDIVDWYLLHFQSLCAKTTHTELQPGLA